MKRFLYINPVVIALLLTVIQSGCLVSVDPDRRIRGTGSPETRSIEVSNFSRVSMAIAGELTIDQGEEEALTISAQPNLFPYIEIFVEGNHLHIETRSNTSLQPTQPIAISLTVKSLNDLLFAGDGSVRVNPLTAEDLRVTLAGSGDIEINQLDAQHLTTTLAGSGDIVVSGTANEQGISLTGSGDIEARNLTSKDVEVEIAGSGDVYLNVSDKLRVSIIGSGSVRYAGNPEVETSILGSGTVGPLN